MALTRSMLKAMGIEDEKTDQIVQEHTQTVERINKELAEANERADGLKELAAQVPDLQKELEDAKAKIPSEDWQAKYNESVKEFEDFKAQVERDKAEAEKKSLYRAVLREAGIDEQRIDAIVKVTDMGAIAVKDGAIEDSEALKESVAKEWAAFIPQESVQGAKVPEPPETSGGATGADPATVQRLAERHARLYGTTDTKE